MLWRKLACDSPTSRLVNPKGRLRGSDWQAYRTALTQAAPRIPYFGRTNHNVVIPRIASNIMARA